MKNRKQLKMILNVIVLLILLTVVLILQQKSGVLLDSKYDFLWEIFIAVMYWIITAPINCLLDTKKKNKF